MPRKITIDRVIWDEAGLHAYRVTLHSSLDIPESADSERMWVMKAIDYHWMESTARQCAKRWSEFYGIPIGA